MSFIDLNHVSRHFGPSTDPVVALDDVSLTVEAGELVGLFGPSGSGKTTLLNIVVGWDAPTAGTVTVPPDLPSDWRGVALVPQGLGLVTELTAAENVELATGPAGLSTSDGAVGPLFARLGLDLNEVGHRLPHQLSLGQQQRIAVARALIASPRLLVADEPTAHQDEDNADLIFDAFESLVDGGGAVLVSTHDPRLLDRLGRVVELVDGRVVAPTTPEG